MRAALRLEAIGDDTPTFLGRVRQRPWVARVLGVGDRGQIEREFVRGLKDYAQANSVGSRGVYYHYTLPPGIYEVNAPVAWTRTERYFIAVAAGRATRISREEVDLWLANEGWA